MVHLNANPSGWWRKAASVADMKIKSNVVRGGFNRSCKCNLVRLTRMWARWKVHRVAVQRERGMGCRQSCMPPGLIN